MTALRMTHEFKALSVNSQQKIADQLEYNACSLYSKYAHTFFCIFDGLKKYEHHIFPLNEAVPYWVNCAVNLLPDAVEILKKDISVYLRRKIEVLINPLLSSFALADTFETSLSAIQFKSPYHYRLCIHLISCVFENTKECLLRLQQDSAAFPSFFSEWNDEVESIQYLDSDPHNGNQVVICLHFPDERKIVYKPRALDGEVYIATILDRMGLTDQGPSLVESLNRDTYGWMKWVSPSFKGKASVLAHQLGVLTAVAATVSLADLHCENVILGESGVTIIDAEAVNVLYPDIRTGKAARYPVVTELGLLPGPEGSAIDHWWDISVMGATPGTRTVPIGFDLDDETGALRPQYYTIQPHHANVKKALGKASRETIQTYMLQGFDTAVSRLKELTVIRPEKVCFRYIHRPTSVYVRTLVRLTDVTFGNDVQVIANELGVYLKDWSKNEEEAMMFDFTSIICREIIHLLYGDIPRFVKQDLCNATTSFVAEDVWALPEVDFSKRLITLALDLTPVKKSKVYLKNKFEVLKESFPIGRLGEIAGIIQDQCCISGENILYGIHSGKASGIPAIEKLNSSLYNGVSGLLLPVGIALLTKQYRFESFYKALLDALFSELKIQCKRREVNTISNGSIGAVYVLSYLMKSGMATDEHLSIFLDQLPYVEWPAHEYDVVSGISGCLLILDAIPPSFKTDLIKKIQGKLIQQLLLAQTKSGGWPSLGKNGLCGFSHGAAGIRYALGRVLVQGIGPDKEIQKAMDRACDFEQRYFNKVSANWLDLRYHGNSKGRRSQFSSWCHGALGIALSESGLKRIGLPYFEGRIAPTLDKLSEYVFNRNSICCGGVALSELVRLNEIRHFDTTQLRRIVEVNSHREEHNSTLSLFKAHWGTDFIDSVNHVYRNGPSILLLE